MLSSPFPKHIQFATVPVTAAGIHTLLPAERSTLSPRAAQKRIQEFAAGRSAAHTALIQAGYTGQQPILVGPARMPLWPAGFTGSITHTTTLAAACVASSNSVKVLGLDIEEIQKDFDLRIQERIASSAELTSFPGGLYSETVKTLLIFSAKETIYKAYYPLVNQYFGYDTVVLKYRPEQNCFTITPRANFLKPVIGVDATVYCIQTGDYLLTYLWE